jgi:hypothetical protein
LCRDRGLPAEDRFGDTVHAVEYLTVRGEDDRHGEVGVGDPSGVVDDLPHGRRASAEPAVLVNLTDCIYRHLLDGEAERRSPNRLDVPATIAEGDRVTRSAR